MSYFIVDVESDGPIIGVHSMVCFGAVLLNEDLTTTFYGKTKPIGKEFIPDILKISGFSREEHESFDDPFDVMSNFAEWLKSNNKNGSPILITDNNGYDASWINYYFHVFIGRNPFGFSSRRIGDLFCGANKNLHYQWKRHRDNEKFPHNHNPVSDAQGNASALLYFLKTNNMKLPK